MGEKRKCKTCGEVKELSEKFFRPDRKHYRLQCIECQNKKNLDFYHSGKGQSWRRQYVDSGKRKEVDRARGAEIKEEGIHSERFRKSKLSQIRSAAKNKGRNFELTLKDIVIPDTCPVLGIEIKLGAKTGDNSPTADRLDNNKGYTKENVRFISWRANLLKRDATFEEIEALYNWMKKELGKE